MLYVDTRWGGDNGIGRFAREVTNRLTTPYASLTERGSPSSAFDVAAFARMRLSADDVLYSPGYNSGPTRARSVLTIHDLIHLDDPAQASTAKNLYYELVVKPAVKRAGVVLTVSETSRERIATWLDDDTVEIRVVGNGSSAAFSPAPADQPLGEPRFLYVGNLRSHKNVGVLMEALKRRPEFRLTVVTSSATGARQLAAQHGVSNQVEVAQGLDDHALAELYRGATATLFPSRMEGFGFPALESFLCGTPVVYWSGCASIAEIAAGSGLAIVDAHNSDAWAEALDAAARDPAMLMADPAERWRARFDWDAVARRVELVLAAA